MPSHADKEQPMFESDARINTHPPVDAQSKPQKRKKRSMTRAQFFHAAKALQEQASKIKGMSHAAAAKYLGSMCGFYVCRKAIKELQDVTGIHWDVVEKAAPDRNWGNNIIRALVRAHVSLCNKLGEPIPEAIQRAYDHIVDQTH